MNKEYWIERYKREGRKMFATGGDDEILFRLACTNLNYLFKKAGIKHVHLLLDYGCGYGRLEPFLYKYADHIIATDILLDVIEVDQYDYVTYIKTDELFEKEPLDVDVVVTYTVMQHIFDDFFKILNLFNYHLKSGGFYIGVERINPKHGGKHLNKYSFNDYKRGFGGKLIYSTNLLTYEGNDIHTGFIFKKI